MSLGAILLVDDEPVMRQLLRAALAPTGARLLEAEDGAEALELAWTDVLASVTASDARHWFAHCGYRTAPK